MKPVNPLTRHCLDECIFVILGATGDLAKRKLIPALYKLAASGSICRFALIGVSIDKTTMQAILHEARTFIPTIDDSIWAKFQECIYYYQMDFHNTAAYPGLKNLLEAACQTHKLCGNKLFYLATMPHHFSVITENLARYDIAEKHKAGKHTEKGTWSRVVYEKPFGSDLKSARALNRAIKKVFDEKQVFRIDHYLGKELVANIALARFTNRVFEPLWNNKHIDSVQIVLSEATGIQDRGAFYDSYGAFKDIVQNHLLQILALIAMEAPEHLTAEQLRDCKVRVLSKVKVTSVVRGQYEGYLHEKGVHPHSQTETFGALRAVINNRRWRGVPFYLKTGKHLNKNEASIHIKFKMVKCLLDFCPMDSNYLTIKIHPDEGFYLELNAKEPGVFNRVVPITMNFSHSTLWGPNTPEAYETLLLDVIRGDHFAFVRSDEIDHSWEIIRQIEKIKTPLYPYAPGSVGPQEMKLLDPKHEIRWRT
jgi:glucose-6-phosphate 1-dehydrogenase